MPQNDFKYQQQFEILFKKYFNPLYNYINSQLKNEEDSREIVQNTFLKIWNYRGKIEYDSVAIKSYLYTTAKNSLIDFIRKKKRQGNEKLDLDKIEHILVEEDDKKLSDLVIMEEIVKALGALKPKTRKIFELNKFNGLTYEEIANKLGISKRAVEDNISRAMKILRVELKENKRLFN